MARLTKSKPSLNVPTHNTQSAESPPLQNAPHKHLSLRKHNRRSIFSERGTDSPIKLDEYEFPSFELQDFDLWESIQHDVTHQAQAMSYSVEVTAHQPSRWRFLRTDWWKTNLLRLAPESTRTRKMLRRTATSAKSWWRSGHFDQSFSPSPQAELGKEVVAKIRREAGQRQQMGTARLCSHTTKARGGPKWVTSRSIASLTTKCGASVN